MYLKHFLDDIPSGQDPDKAIKLCRTYHKLLWSRELPNGEHMNLEYGKNGNKIGKNFYGCSNYPRCKYIRDYDYK